MSWHNLIEGDGPALILASLAFLLMSLGSACIVTRPEGERYHAILPWFCAMVSCALAFGITLAMLFERIEP